MALRCHITWGALVAGLVFSGAAGALSQDPREERRAIVAEDQAASRSIVIQPSDMPGWRPLSRFPRGGGGGCPHFDPNLSAYTITGEFRGRQFVRRMGEIGEVFTSAAWVYATETDAAGEWRIYTSAASTACFKAQLGKTAPSGSITVTSPPVPLNLPRVAPRQFGRRYRVLWFKGGGELGNIYVDEIKLGRGRSEVTLLVQRVGEDDSPPSAKLERQLTKLLGRRLALAFP